FLWRMMEACERMPAARIAKSQSGGQRGGEKNGAMEQQCFHAAFRLLACLMTSVSRMVAFSTASKLGLVSAWRTLRPYSIATWAAAPLRCASSVDLMATK